MKNYIKTQHTKTIALLQELRDTAFFKADRYRFDPVVGKLHSDYVDELNTVLEEFDKV